MPDFGIAELLGTLGGAGGLASIFGAGAAPELAAAAVPLDIGAATGFGAAADAAAAGAGATGLASGLGETAGLGVLAGAPTAAATAAETLGTGGTDLSTALGFGADAAPAVAADSGITAFAPTTPAVNLPGVTGTGPISTALSLPGAGAAPAGASPVAPVGAAGAANTVDLTSVDPSLITNAGAGGSPASAGSSFLSKLSPSNLASGAVDQVAKNPLGLAAGLGALGVGLLGNKSPSGTNQLGQIASSQGAQGQQLEQYLQSGTLPPGMQASVDAAAKAAKTKIIQNYAARNLPTDPTKNSSLQQELANVDQNAIITTAQLGQQLLTTGLSETQLSADVYNKLVGIDQAQQQQIQAALANFARGLGGGGINLKLA